MHINWGARIAILYIGFVALIITLVTLSMKRRVDLVANDYYGEEIAYQKVIDAGKNQSALSVPVAVQPAPETITLTFPAEFKQQHLNGTIQLYSPQQSDYDRQFTLSTDDNTFIIPRAQLRKAHYIMKISWTANGKNYYQETNLNLSAS
ncbi:FixH family protein [Chitinophagaceae bacterium MMS25-I14]